MCNKNRYISKIKAWNEEVILQWPTWDYASLHRVNVSFNRETKSIFSGSLSCSSKPVRERAVRSLCCSLCELWAADLYSCEQLTPGSERETICSQRQYRRLLPSPRPSQLRVQALTAHDPTGASTLSLHHHVTAFFAPWHFKLRLKLA